MNYGLRIIELTEKIETTEGWRVTSKINALNHSFNVFIGNYDELFNLLEAFETNYDLALEVMNREKRENLEGYLGEITRLFHNYLASAKTLIDHTRVFFQSEYMNSSFEEEYNIKIKDFFIDVPLAKFIQDLRNFSLHRTLPITGATMVFSIEAGVSHTININVKGLKEWTGWTKKASQFLKECDGKINIRNIIAEYTVLVTEFQTWFGNQQMIIHKVELDELELLKEELQELYDKESIL